MTAQSGHSRQHRPAKSVLSIAQVRRLIFPRACHETITTTRASGSRRQILPGRCICRRFDVGDLVLAIGFLQLAVAIAALRGWLPN